MSFSPSGRQWACSSTAGLLVYSLDAQLLFDPYSFPLSFSDLTFLYMTLFSQISRHCLPSITLSVLYYLSPNNAPMQLSPRCEHHDLFDPGYPRCQGLPQGPHCTFLLSHHPCYSECFAFPSSLKYSFQMALRLNEDELTAHVVESIPTALITLLAQQLQSIYIQRYFLFEPSPHYSHSFTYSFLHWSSILPLLLVPFVRSNYIRSISTYGLLSASSSQFFICLLSTHVMVFVLFLLPGLTHIHVVHRMIAFLARYLNGQLQTPSGRPLPPTYCFQLLFLTPTTSLRFSPHMIYLFVFVSFILLVHLICFSSEVMTECRRRHVEFATLWLKSVLTSHGQYCKVRRAILSIFIIPGDASTP